MKIWIVNGFIAVSAISTKKKNDVNIVLKLIMMMVVHI